MDDLSSGHADLHDEGQFSRRFRESRIEIQLASKFNVFHECGKNHSRLASP